MKFDGIFCSNDIMAETKNNPAFEDPDVSEKPPQRKPQRRITKFIVKRFNPKRWLGLDEIQATALRLSAMLAQYREMPLKTQDYGSFDALLRKYGVSVYQLDALVRYHKRMIIMYALCLFAITVYIYFGLWKNQLFLESLVSSFLTMPIGLLALKHAYCYHLTKYKKFQLTFTQWVKQVLRISL